MTATLRSRPGGFASGSGRIGALTRLTRVIEYRRILKLLVTRDLKVRYAGSALGYVWTILDPLLLTLVYWFIFTKIVQRGAPGEDPYLLFLLSGQLFWGWFNSGVSATTRALRSEAQMVRSSNVPRELWVLRVICSKFIEYLYSLPILALFAIVYTKMPTWHIVLLPVAWLLMFMLLTGIGLILAPINILVRDVERVVPIVLRLMFYMSPILYSVTVVTHRVQAVSEVYKFNPVVGPIVLARSSFFPNELRWEYVEVSGAACIVIFAIGMFTFMRLERQVLKEV